MDVLHEQSLGASVVGDLQSPDVLEGLWIVKGPGVGYDACAVLDGPENRAPEVLAIGDGLLDQMQVLGRDAVRLKPPCLLL